MKTAVMTDSNSGITQNEARELGIFSLPMPVIIDGETCYEGIDLTQEMFYASLTGGKEVTTEMSRIVIGAAGSGLDENEEREWTDMLKEAFPEATVYYNPLSFSIGSHTGPGALGTAISIRR